MKLDLRQFRLEAPQVAADKLPDGFAQSATNCRVLSGNLEAWKQDTAATRNEELVTKSGTIKSIHLMDIDGSDGGPFLLHWTQEVNVAKGPIGGDTTERTYFTGNGSPKVTTIALATTAPGQDATGYPHDWETLGVPAPTDAPIVSVSPPDDIEENEIALTNPGAESGVTGWTVTSGTLIADATAFHTGTASFASNDAGGTEAYQEVDIVSAGLSPGQRLQVKAWLKGQSSANHSRVRIEAWGGSGRVDGAETAWSDAMSSFTQASAEILSIPDTASTIRIYQEFEGAVSTAFIDDIELFVLSSQFTADGSSLADWSVTGSGGTVTAGISAEGHDKVFKFTSGGGQTAVMNRNFNTQESPAYRVSFQYTARENVFLAVVLDADAAGIGSQIRFAGKSVYLDQTGGWGGTYSSETKLADGASGTAFTDTSGEWWTARIDVTAISGGKKRVAITALRVSNGQSYVSNVTAEFTPSGNYLGFKAWDNGSSNDGYLDNVFITVSPAATSNGQSSAATLADYVYTIANSANSTLSMSGTSPASEEVQIGAAPSVFITTETTPPSGYEADVKYIWRRVTGSDGNSTYRLVKPEGYPDGEIPIGIAQVHDISTDSQLGDAIPDVVGFEAPPTDAHSIVTAANGITYVASKNQVFPSAINQPHAYPPLWAKATDYPVVGLATLAADVYVLTQSYPYVITGSDPSALDMEKLARPIGCRSKRSIAVDRRLGVVYCAADGLAYANKADVGLLTDGIVTEREWAGFFPDQVTGVIYDNNYIGFNDTFGFWIDLSGKTGIGRLDFVATALFVNPLTGDLHMVVGGQHVTFNTSSSLRTYKWRSKKFELPRPASMACADVRVSGSGTRTMRLYADGNLYHTKTITASGEFLLPDTVASDYFEVELEGTAPIKSVEIAESMEELK